MQPLNNFGGEFADSTNRKETVALALEQSAFDIIVIGGGIHGAAFARIAASGGARTLLLEAADFASGTSSRSSKMAHGGLRYLEMLDFQQVFEGIRAREDLFAELPNLVRPEPFLIPIPHNAWWQRFKLGIGLTIYDLLVRNPARKHSWISKNELISRGYTVGAEPLSGCFQYFDGLMDDARLVTENIISARRAGALTLNYAEVEGVQHPEKGLSTVRWVDHVNGSKHELKARLVVNCAGPWAPLFQGGQADNLGASLDKPLLRAVYSRGTHLVFNVPWNGPSLFLPMEGKARYYFVWPHFAGTMVGTTERETGSLEVDPMPTHDEVEEILMRLKKDLPDKRLDRKSLIYCFAGVRTLPKRSASKDSTRLSRKHIWSLKQGILSLVGGKYTTAVWTAREGFQVAAKHLGLKMPKAIEPLPGSAAAEQIAKIRSQLAAYDLLDNPSLDRLMERYGKRAEELVPRKDLLSEVAPGCTAAEIRVSTSVEQAITVEDIMRRRLLLEYLPDHGVGALPAVVKELKKTLSSAKAATSLSSENNLLGFGQLPTLNEQLSVFEQRMKRIDELCRPGSKTSLLSESTGLPGDPAGN